MEYIETLTFGQLIDHLRHQQGLGVREMSRRTTLSLSHCQDLAKDVKHPRDKTLRKLAVVLAVDANWLISERDKRYALGKIVKLGFPPALAARFLKAQPLTAEEQTALVAVLDLILARRV